MNSIFEKGEHLDPRYDHLDKYVLTMYRAFWTPAIYEQGIRETDVPHFETSLPYVDQEAIRRGIALISLVEDKVKTYWPTLVLDLPQTIIGDVGGVFGQSEVTHRRAYHSLTKALGVDLQEMMKHPELEGRVKYLNKHIEQDPKITGKKRVLKKLVLFTALVERISLYTWFYYLMSYAQANRGLKTISALQTTTATEENCFKDGTEILTKRGWIDLKDVKAGDIVYGYKDGVIREEPVLRVIEKDWKGNLIKFGNSRHKSTMTPNHDIFYHRNGVWNKKHVEDFRPDTRSFFPVTANLVTDNSYRLSWMDRLKIAIQADGSKISWTNKKGHTLPRGVDGGYNYILSLYKPRKIERLRYILSNILLENPDFKYKERKTSDKSRKTQGVTFSFHIDDSNTGTLKSLKWLNDIDASKQFSEEVIEEIMNWDGSYSGDSMCYCSTNKENVDVVEKIAILAGYRTSIYENRDSERKDTYNNCFKLGMSGKDSVKVCSHSYTKELEYYNGKVRCVTVPSGGIITRSEDGVMITGNCHYSFGIDVINIIKEQHPTLWDDYLTELVTKNIKDAHEAELKLIDWVFSKGTPSHITKRELINFMNDNFNVVCKDLGLDISFEVDEELFENKNAWFNRKVFITGEPDFFSDPVGGYANTEVKVDLDTFEF